MQLNTYIYLRKKHCLYFLDYGRKQIVPSMIFSTVDIMHFLSYRKMFRACGPSTISYRLEAHYIHSRKYHLGTICIYLISRFKLPPATTPWGSFHWEPSFFCHKLYKWHYYGMKRSTYFIYLTVFQDILSV